MKSITCHILIFFLLFKEVKEGLLTENRRPLVPSEWHNDDSSWGPNRQGQDATKKVGREMFHKELNFTIYVVWIFLQSVVCQSLFVHL